MSLQLQLLFKHLLLSSNSQPNRLSIAAQRLRFLFELQKKKIVFPSDIILFDSHPNYLTSSLEKCHRCLGHHGANAFSYLDNKLFCFSIESG